MADPNHQIETEIIFKVNEGSANSAEQRVANLAQNISVDYNAGQGTGNSAGGSSRSAASSAAKSASDQSATSMVSGAPMPAATIPSPVAEGTVPSIRAAYSNVGSPSTSRIRMDEAFASQDQFTNRGQFADYYAQQNYEGGVTNSAASMRLATARESIGIDKFLNRVDDRRMGASRKAVNPDDEEVLSKYDSVKSMERSVLDTLSGYDSESQHSYQGTGVPGKPLSMYGAAHKTEAVRQRRVASLSQYGASDESSNEELDAADLKRTQETLATAQENKAEAQRNKVKRASMGHLRKSRMVQKYQDMGYPAADISMSDDDLYEMGTRIRHDMVVARQIKNQVIDKTLIGSHLDVTKAGSLTDMSGMSAVQRLVNYGMDAGLYSPGYANQQAFASSMQAKGPYQINWNATTRPPHPLDAGAQYPMGAGPGYTTGVYNFAQAVADDNNKSLFGRANSVVGQIPGATLSGYGGRFLKGGLAEIGRYAGQEAELSRQETLTGRRDIGGQAGALGSLAGGLVGAAIGSLFPGFGTFIGAGIGSQAGNQIGQLMVARQLADISRQEFLQPMSVMQSQLFGMKGSFGPYTGGQQDVGAGSAVSGYAGRSYNNPATALMEKYSEMARVRSDFIGRHYWGSGSDQNAYKDRYATPEQLSQMYSGAYGSIMESGLDPNRMMDVGGTGNVVLGSSGDAAVKAGTEQFNRTGATLWQKREAIVKIAIGNTLNYRGKVTDDKQLPMWQGIAEIAAERYGKAAPGILEKVYPILGQLSQNDGNIADILMKHGVGATNSFVEVTTPVNKDPRVKLQQLMFASENLQRDNRRMQFSADTPRSQGERAMSLIMDERSLISGLPGGSNSLTYADMGEQLRLATFKRDREQDTMSYGLPMAALEGQEQRRQFLPNMPGYGLALSMQRMGLRAPYIKQRQGRYAAQVASGSLSEEEQLGQFNEIQGLMTEQARDLGYLAEGGQDRALMFSGGRPSFFSRMNSMSMARSAVWRAGSPQVGVGSENGKHLQFQNDFFSAFDAPGFNAMGALSPRNLNGPMSYPGAASGRTSQQADAMIKLLEELVKLQQDRNSKTSIPGGGARPGERSMNHQGNLDSGNFNQRSSYRGQ